MEDIVSLTPIGEPRQKITTATLRDKKFQHQPITCLTAYDYASARLVDAAGIDIILVGDSLAMTMTTHFPSPPTRCCITLGQFAAVLRTHSSLSTCRMAHTI